jgi:hypothetical protein
MANDRGTYGTSHNGVSHNRIQFSAPFLGAEPPGQRRSSSIWKWIVGGVVVGGAVLWARHQAAQTKKLYKETGLRHQGFLESAREDARALPSMARETFRDLTRTKKSR